MIRAVFAIIGGILVHLCLVSYYVFGNLTPYVISYLRNRTDEHTLRNVDNLWILNVASFVSPFGMVFGGVLDRHYGLRISTFIGCALFCVGWALTYFTVKKSLVLVALSYGALTQFGFAIAYGPPVQNAAKWFPKRTALAVGAIVCGVGGGALVFNQVVTAYVNPNNLTPDLKTPNDEKYFTDKGVLDRVPMVFLILAGIYAICQCVGILALSKPPDDETKTKNILQESEHKETGSRLPVKEVLWKICKSKNGIIVLGFAFLFTAGMVFAISLYKAYGQTFISNDHFLALVGSISSVFNSLCRPLWGWLMDRFGFKVAVKIASALFTCFSCTIMLTESMDKAAFMSWICGLYSSYCCLFSICPATLGKLFGKENMIITMGPFLGAGALATITGGVVGLSLKNLIGWHGLFLFSGFLGALAFLLTFFFDGKDQDGSEI